MENQKHPIRDFLIIFGIVVSIITALVTTQGDTMISLGYCSIGETFCILGASFLFISVSSLTISLIVIGILFVLNKVIIRLRNEKAKDEQKQDEGKTKSKPEIVLEKFQLTEGVTITHFSKGLYNAINEVYTATLINESGHDIKKCFVLLDEVWTKNDDSSWELKGRDIFDKPFDWHNRYINLDGQTDIDHNNRASFILIKTTNRFNSNSFNSTDVSFGFFFSFFGAGDGPHGLIEGSEHRLLISVRAKDENGKSIIFRYKLHLHLKDDSGLFDFDIERLAI